MRVAIFIFGLFFRTHSSPRSLYKVRFSNAREAPCRRRRKPGDRTLFPRSCFRQKGLSRSIRGSLSVESFRSSTTRGSLTRAGRDPPRFAARPTTWSSNSPRRPPSSSCWTRTRTRPPTAFSKRNGPPANPPSRATGAGREATRPLLLEKRRLDTHLSRRRTPPPGSHERTWKTESVARFGPRPRAARFSTFRSAPRAPADELLFALCNAPPSFVDGRLVDPLGVAAEITERRVQLATPWAEALAQVPGEHLAWRRWHLSRYFKVGGGAAAAAGDSEER